MQSKFEIVSFRGKSWATPTLVSFRGLIPFDMEVPPGIKSCTFNVLYQRSPIDCRDPELLFLKLEIPDLKTK